MICSTSEMLELITKDAGLIFVCFIGMYEGEVLSFNNTGTEIIWNSDNSGVLITNEFLKCKWMILQSVKERIYWNVLPCLHAAVEIPVSM